MKLMLNPRRHASTNHKPKIKPIHSPIFRSFLISYVLILIIPMLTGFISYYVSAGIIKSSSLEASTMLLNQSKDVLDRRMEEVENITRQLSLDQELNYVLNEQVDTDSYNVYALWKSWRNTAAYSLTNTFLEDFYIYLNNYHAVFTPSGVFVRPDDFFDLYHYQNVEPKQWKEQILGKIHRRETLPLQPYNNNGKKTNVITYLQSIPFDSFQHSLGTVVILIDESEIVKMLERIPQQYGGWAYISDKDGNAIARIGIDDTQFHALNIPEPNLNQPSSTLVADKTLLISSRSAYNGWTYVVGLPKSVVMQQSAFIAKVTWTITASTLLLGIVAALLFAYRNSAPINRIVTVFREQTGQGGYRGKNAFDFLQGNISNLLASQRSLEEELKRQLPLLEDAFVKRLLKGEFDSLQEVRTSMYLLPNLNLKSEAGYTAIIRINGYSGVVSKEIIRELNAARWLVKKCLLEEAGAWQLSVTDIDSDKIGLLLTLGEEETDPDSPDMASGIEAMFARLREEVKEEYRIQITVALGGSFDALSDISRSFEEAKGALDYSMLREEEAFIRYRDVIKESTSYYYPIDMELRMLNAVKIGELQEVHRIFEQLLEHNFSERQLSAEMVQQLFGELKGTFFKLLQHSPFTDQSVSQGLKARVEQLQLSTSLERFRNEVLGLLEAFCSRVLKMKEDSTGEMIGKIIAYLDNHYSDADMNLYKISLAVELPEKSISQLFKEQTGEHVSDYLEKIRIKNATDYLFNSEHTIDEISQYVGYNSAHAFRRAFKRVSGVSPSIYRKTVN
ncbi:helix-turn-helix domain-containing protein [Paenibacillus sp. GCM10023248]|uniref:helix-turn-helix domain-containing protein n=1 Tax=Bacillales TaxID=1385 RepID=UPI002377E0CA|nr:MULTISPECIES: helix-turn-helix domain-containing protein [Bacillales]MDD9266108.1 helix-turn-helix domain-containing protein [Paenibacillus sp. MAHUQ-63]MDR6878284.1 AraC-like DNA-binding protein [Bacillus sp. 3255]